MQSFRDIFGFAADVTAQAPGRVNLLGEHTDYNDGYVLPTTIPQTTRVAIASSRSDEYRFYSVQLKAAVSYRAGETPDADFASYIYGCIEVLRERGYTIPPVAIHIDSNVPIGSGLSSSAALEVAVLRGLRELLKLPVDDVEIARMAQEAEIRYARVHCGIMDQMASSLGDAEHMLFLDTRTLARRLLPLPANAELVVLDSGVPRTLAASGYNTRQAECARAAQLLGVRALRDITDPEKTQALPAPLDRRARHVVTENARVLEAARGVSATEFGMLMNASHASLRDDYEVSIVELDRLVRLLQDHGGVYGARLTGAGFGGACVALVRKSAASTVKHDVLKIYNATGTASGRALV